MKISGFTIVKNAVKFYYPLKESISSILPIVDEFIIALGDCDDNTREVIESIGDPKIKIIDTVWNTKEFPSGTILAQQTDIAKSHCSGDWLFYIQADEVIHEDYLGPIKARCEELLNDNEVDGLLFKYIHFWADYNHAFTEHHKWYRNEIRIIRNRPDIHSWRDAQSFRKIPEFSKEKYLSKEGTEKLSVASVNAFVYHYGWVRPPKLMGKKQANFSNYYKQSDQQEDELEVISKLDFGPIELVPTFKGKHPKVMADKIKDFHWANDLNYSKKWLPDEQKRKHDKLKYRLLTFLENKIFKREMWTFKNYILLKK